MSHFFSLIFLMHKDHLKIVKTIFYSIIPNEIFILSYALKNCITHSNGDVIVSFPPVENLEDIEVDKLFNRFYTSDNLEEIPQSLSCP